MSGEAGQSVGEKRTVCQNGVVYGKPYRGVYEKPYTYDEVG